MNTETDFSADAATILSDLTRRAAMATELQTYGFRGPNARHPIMLTETEAISLAQVLAFSPLIYQNACQTICTRRQFQFSRPTDAQALATGFSLGFQNFIAYCATIPLADGPK